MSEKLTGMGLKDLVLDAGARSVKGAFQDQILIRRAALLSKFKPLGFPTITFPCEMADNVMKETLIASLFVAKYAGIIVLSDFEGENVFPLLLERLNIYTDPQRPMTTEQGIYPINNPDQNSPVLVTCNFSLTYFIVSGEIENSRVPTWLCVMDTEGLSVMTAWAAGKFVGDAVGPFIKKCRHRRQGCAQEARDSGLCGGHPGRPGRGVARLGDHGGSAGSSALTGILEDVEVKNRAKGQREKGYRLSVYPLTFNH